jgi:hypothetical protein
VGIIQDLEASRDETLEYFALGADDMRRSVRSEQVVHRV